MLMKISNLTKTTLSGTILSLGAPLGYILLSYFFSKSDLDFNIFTWGIHLIKSKTLLMSYLTFPTIIVFTAFAYYQGKLNQKLDHKREQMEELLHLVAHDIRNPLTIIGHASDFILDELTGTINDEQRKLGLMIKRQAGVISGLITELLDLYQFESGNLTINLQSAHLDNTTQEVLNEMEPFFTKKDIQVDCQFESNTNILFDDFKIKQVLRNIIGNALKYIADKGNISIRIYDEANEVKISICNDGPPIPEDKIKTIFEKFGQSKDSDKKKGYGLGLYISSSIMKLHQGNIYAENLNPHGVAFHLSFPRKINPVSTN